MEIHRMKPENPIIIVDEAEFDRIDSIAKLKEEEVEKTCRRNVLAPCQIKWNINALPYKWSGKVIRQQVITELNYDERGYP